MIKRLLIQPYNLLIVAAAILGIGSFFHISQSIEFHLSNTLVVVSDFVFTMAISIFFLLAWIIYRITDKYLVNRYLTWFHVVTTIVVLGIMVAATNIDDKLFESAKEGFVSFKTVEENQAKAQRIIIPIVLVFFLGQFAYMVNLFGGLFKQKP